MQSANKDILTSSFPICSSFISSYCSKTSDTILNKSGKTGQPYLIPDFSGNSWSVSPFIIILAVVLPYTAFIMLSQF